MRATCELTGNKIELLKAGKNAVVVCSEIGNKCACLHQAKNTGCCDMLEKTVGDGEVESVISPKTAAVIWANHFLLESLSTEELIALNQKREG